MGHRTDADAVNFVRTIPSSKNNHVHALQAVLRIIPHVVYGWQIQVLQ